MHDILLLVHSTFNPCKLINSKSTLAYQKTAKIQGPLHDEGRALITARKIWCYNNAAL